MVKTTATADKAPQARDNDSKGGKETTATKVERIVYRSDVNLFPPPKDWKPEEEGQVYLGPQLKGSETPENWDSKIHKPLNKGDFKNEYDYLDWRAADYEARAASMRKEAEQIRKLGSSADRAKLKRIDAFQEKMLELAEGMGGDVNFVEMLGKEKGEALNALLAAKKAEDA